MVAVATPQLASGLLKLVAAILDKADIEHFCPGGKFSEAAQFGEMEEDGFQQQEQMHQPRSGRDRPLSENVRVPTISSHLPREADGSWLIGRLFPMPCAQSRVIAELATGHEPERGIVPRSCQVTVPSEENGRMEWLA